MITYTLWETLRQKRISQYRLIHYFGFSSGELDRIRKNFYISTHTIDVLCNILDCQVQDIIEFHKDTELRPELGAIPNQTPLGSTKSSAPADPEESLWEDEFRS